MMDKQHTVIYLVLKRLRAPLILLIVAWTVSILGLTLIPGVTVDGEERYMTIFESFYFVSYMATTIGFGEPHFGFTDTQRLWVSFSIYLTVISWLVAIGNIISLLQDPGLQKVWRKNRFSKQVRHLNGPFYIICGYGETGEILLHKLIDKNYQCVVLDNNPERINLLDLDSSIYRVPFYQGDASSVEVLKLAGLELENCTAVLAMTSNDKINVKIAVAAKLLRSGVKVICRTHSKEAMANAKSFDTDHIINPDKNFAEIMSLAFRKPSIQQLSASLLRRPGRSYMPKLELPKGHWIVCGNTQLGNEMGRFLEYEGMDYTLIDEHITEGVDKVKGRATEAVALRAAGIDKSVGVVAATSDDTDNFSIIMTARHLKHDLYLMAKQNAESNHHIFQNAGLDTIMEASRLIAWQTMPLITQPKLALFLRLARHQDELWGAELITQLQAVSDVVPETYLLKINQKHAPAVCQYLETGTILRLQELFEGEEEDAWIGTALPLMLLRDGKEVLLPKKSTALKYGDVFLMASNEAVWNRLNYVISNDQEFYYRIHGQEKPVSLVIAAFKRLLNQRKQQRQKRLKQEEKKPDNHR